MSVEETQQVLEQFKQSFFQEPTDVDACSSLLPKLKVRRLVSAPLARYQLFGREMALAVAQAGAGRARPRGAGRCVTALRRRHRCRGSARCLAHARLSPLERNLTPPLILNRVAPFNRSAARRGQVPVAAPAAHGGHQPAGADAREYVPARPAAPACPRSSDSAPR